MALHYWPTCAPNHAILKAGRLTVIHSAELLKWLRKHASTVLYCLCWSPSTANLISPHNTDNEPTRLPDEYVNEGYAHTKTQWPTPTVQFPKPARNSFSQFHIKLSDTTSCIFIPSLFIIDALSLPTVLRPDRFTSGIELLLKDTKLYLAIRTKVTKANWIDSDFVFHRQKHLSCCF